MTPPNIMLGLAAALAATAPAPAASQAVTISGVQAALAATRTMVADFTQTANDGRQVRGTMTLQRPGRIRFEYQRGVPLLVVSDGRNLSMVDYEVGQVSKWPVRSTPLGVLLDPAADLSRYARVLPAGASPIPNAIAVEAQDPKRPDLGRITFFLVRDGGAPGGLALTGWRALDAQGNLTTIRLANARYNVDVPGSRFAFRDPRPQIRPPGKTG